MSKVFAGLAENYQKYRPDYPEDLLAQLRSRLPLAEQSGTRFAADIGAGTGISTRAISRAIGHGWSVIGVEPNNDMRQRADELQERDIKYVAGYAENLPFQDKVMDLITVGQAIQFFNRPIFYREVGRVLRKDGLLAVFQNERQWKKSDFLEDYEQFVERLDPGYSRNYRKFNLLAELDEVDWLKNPEMSSASWNFCTSIDNFIGMTLSRSTMKPIVKKFGEDFIADEIHRFSIPYCGSGEILSIPYETELYLANRI